MKTNEFETLHREELDWIEKRANQMPFWRAIAIVLFVTLLYSASADAHPGAAHLKAVDEQGMERCSVFPLKDRIIIYCEVPIHGSRTMPNGSGGARPKGNEDGKTMPHGSAGNRR